MQPAIFLDRDGVIIENVSTYVRSWDDVKIFPQALSALARVAKSKYKIIIVTNQSAVGRGVISLDIVHKINDRLVDKIEKCDGRIDQIYICPHHPQDQCSCRKPQPGMILRAQTQLSIDLRKSYLIGDALTDLQAGIAAGVGHNILLRTGRGNDQNNLPLADSLRPFPIYPDLETALGDLINIS